jgi:hypothetical protein
LVQTLRQRICPGYVDLPTVLQAVAVGVRIGRIGTRGHFICILKAIIVDIAG